MILVLTRSSAYGGVQVMFQGHGESTVDIRLKRKDRTYRPNVRFEGGRLSLG